MSAINGFQIHFELDAPEDIEPWGHGSERSLHWFGLTCGHYWISTPRGEVLRYTEEAMHRWGLNWPYVDYQVARLFEDLEILFAPVLEPVPIDVAKIVTDVDWYRRAETWRDAGEDGDGRWDLWYDATQWWHERALDTAYLSSGPHFNLWRVGDEVFFHWEISSNQAKDWTLPNGRFSVSAKEFKTVTDQFFDGVLDAMQKRIEGIVADGWNRADCHLDIPQLVKEQIQRTNLLRTLRNKKSETDWDIARKALVCLETEMKKSSDRTRRAANKKPRTLDKV